MGVGKAHGSELLAQVTAAMTVVDLAHVLRQLRRREARLRGGRQLSYRDLASRTGWSHATVGEYFVGRTLPPTGRFDALICLLGAGPAEQAALATARDRVEEGRRTAAPAASGPDRATPRQLPSDVPHFTGRQVELALLDTLLAGPDGSSVVVLSGAAGVGKTALAVRWGHRARGLFPDGAVYVNLRGYHPQEPVEPAAALVRLLTSLAPDRLEDGLGEDDLAAAYRTVLDQRRMLILLDNACSAEQVRPLLPGTSSCSVVVTSRDHLAGLAAFNGAYRLMLDPLPPLESHSLLQRLIGPRVDSDPDAARTMAEQCAHLPLALRVGAELASARPAVQLRELVQELSDQRRRLVLLDAGGDPQSTVRAVLSWSHRHLPPGAARAFRLAALHPGQDFDAYSIAALTGQEVAEARGCLDVLWRANLVEVSGAGRYTMHDLLRAYARERVEEDAETDRRAALERLFDYYLATAAATMDTLHPAERHRRPQVAAAATPIPDVTASLAAQTWLDLERANFALVAGCMLGQDRTTHVTTLARLLYRYLGGGHHSEAEALHQHAVSGARRAGDYLAEGHALTNLSMAHWRRGRLDVAGGLLGDALMLFRLIGDRGGQARALTNLGLVHWQQGQLQSAGRYLREALPLHREVADRTGEANTLTNLGAVHWRLGRLEEAATEQLHALELFDDLGDRGGRAVALGNLGIVSLRQRRPQQAAQHLQAALALFRRLGERTGEAEALTNIGAVRLLEGNREEAEAALRSALAICEDNGDRTGEAQALNGLADALRAGGNPEEARRCNERVLSMSLQSEDSFEQARAHAGIGYSRQLSGDRPGARRGWQRALAIYARLAVPEEKEMRLCLEAGRSTVARGGSEQSGR